MDTHLTAIIELKITKSATMVWSFNSDERLVISKESVKQDKIERDLEKVTWEDNMTMIWSGNKRSNWHSIGSNGIPYIVKVKETSKHY